jgi:choline dehydrogenase-like flavoprotein
VQNVVYRVLRTTGLRVVDASVIPGVISGQANAATVMIAEMASSFMTEARSM